MLSCCDKHGDAVVFRIVCCCVKIMCIVVFRMLPSSVNTLGAVGKILGAVVLQVLYC